MFRALAAIGWLSERSEYGPVGEADARKLSKTDNNRFARNGCDGTYFRLKRNGGHLGRINTCFISSPAGADLGPLREALSRRNIRVVVPEDLPTGADWSNQIAHSIASVDLVIGVLTSQRRSQWVLFELGQAAALGRQIMLIAPPKLALMPAHLMRFLVVRANLTNREAINFALDQLVASPERISGYVPSKNLPRSALGARADDYAADLRSLLEHEDFRGVERVILEALRGAGTDIVSEATNPDLGADIAVWSDALQPLMGNPLLIEVKARLRRPEDLQRAATQLAAATAASGTLWGLLLYGEGVSPSWLSKKSLPPNILIYSYYELLNQLRTRSFPEIVRDLRNHRVHGEAF